MFLGVVTLCLSIPMGDKMTQLAGLVNFGALASFILLNFAVFLFFFIREKKRNTFGDIVKYLICPWIGIAILVYVFTGFETMTYIVGVVWLILGLIVGAVKSKGFKEVPRRSSTWRCSRRKPSLCANGAVRLLASRSRNVTTWQRRLRERRLQKPCGDCRGASCYTGDKA